MVPICALNVVYICEVLCVPVCLLSMPSYCLYVSHCMYMHLIVVSMYLFAVYMRLGVVYMRVIAVYMHIYVNK